MTITDNYHNARIIAFSGGADSTALALIEKEGIPVFTDTGWEFAETYQHILSFESKTQRIVTRISMGDTLPNVISQWRFLPGHKSRFCTRISKIKPFKEFLATLTNPTLLVGIRADEDRTGMILPGVKIEFPLADRGITRDDVMTICREHDLLPPTRLYMARGGCQGCFYKRASEIRAMVHETPQVIDELIALEESIQDQRQQYAVMFPNIKMPLRRFRDAILSGSQLSLFDDNEIPVGKACGMFCNR